MYSGEIEVGPSVSSVSQPFYNTGSLVPKSTVVTTEHEAHAMFNAAEDQRHLWRAAVNTALHEIDHALHNYHHAKRQLTLADKRASQARLVITRSGFPNIARPRKKRQAGRVRRFGSMSSYSLPYTPI